MVIAFNNQMLTKRNFRGCVMRMPYECKFPLKKDPILRRKQEPNETVGFGQNCVKED